MAVEDHTMFYAILRLMDDEQLFGFFHSLYTINVLQLVALATGSIALREYLAHLGAEYRTWKLLIQGRVMPARLAIILVRYAYIGAFLTAVYFMLGKPKPHDCNPLYRSVFGLYTVLWGAAGSIFLMRLNIIFARQKAVMALFTFLWAGCIGLWLFVTTRLHATEMPKMMQFPYGPTCMTGRFPKIGAIAWGGSIVFDSVVFIATFIRFRNASKAKGGKSVQLRSRKWIFRSNLYYFAASFFFNAAMLFSALFVNDSVLSNVGNSLAFAIHCCVATRLVFNTRGWATSGSVDDEDDVILNTFNKNRREGGNNTLGVASRITYTVDETIVTSAGDHLEGGNNRRDAHDDPEASHPQYSYSHRGSIRGSEDRDYSQRDNITMRKTTPPTSRRQTPAQMHSDYTPEIGSRQESMPKVSTAVRKKPVGRSRRERQSTDSLEEKKSTNDHQYGSRHRKLESGDITRPPIAYMGNSVSHSNQTATTNDQVCVEAEIAQPSGDHNTVENLNYTPTYAEQQARASSLFYANSSANLSPATECFDLRASSNSIAPIHLMAQSSSSSSNTPPSPGTLSNPPSYSALDQHIRQTASSSSLRSPASPASYEIQQSENRQRRPSRDQRQR